jgi:hypothetical protein
MEGYALKMERFWAFMPSHESSGESFKWAQSAVVHLV